ncbi:MAG: DNA polymerase III subunit delta [Candidatus Eisenbacteria bacterium]|nr:DNA polymerase III subunit delta [Candidatus Eisenbacteria bacterium]
MSQNELLRRAEKGERFGAYLFFGKDEFRKRLAIDQLLKSLSQEKIFAFDFEKLHADEIPIDELLAKAGSVGLFSGNKIIVVFEILDFDADERPRLLEYLRSPLSATSLIFTSQEKDVNRSPLFKVIEGSNHGVVVDFPQLTNRDAERWVRGEVKKAGKEISQGAIDMLLESCGMDLWTVGNELEKLIAYAGTSPALDQETVENVQGFGKEISVFEVAEKTSQKNRKAAFFALEKNLLAGTERNKVFPAISREYGLLAVSKAAGAGFPIPQHLRYVAWKINKLGPQAESLPWEDLRASLSSVFESEFELKNSRVPWDLGIELLLHKLTKK